MSEGGEPMAIHGTRTRQSMRAARATSQAPTTQAAASQRSVSPPARPPIGIGSTFVTSAPTTQDARVACTTAMREPDPTSLVPPPAAVQPAPVHAPVVVSATVPAQAPAGNGWSVTASILVYIIRLVFWLSALVTITLCGVLSGLATFAQSAASHSAELARPVDMRLQRLEVVCKFSGGQTTVEVDVGRMRRDGSPLPTQEPTATATPVANGEQAPPPAAEVGPGTLQTAETDMCICPPRPCSPEPLEKVPVSPPTLTGFDKDGNFLVNLNVTLPAHVKGVTEWVEAKGSSLMFGFSTLVATSTARLLAGSMMAKT